jgi:hypothetical protein
LGCNAFVPSESIPSCGVLLLYRLHWLYTAQTKWYYCAESSLLVVIVVASGGGGVGAIVFMTLPGRIPIPWMHKQGNGNGNGNGNSGGAAIGHQQLPHSWRRGLSVSMILLVAVIRAGVSYRELLVSYSRMAYNDNDNVHHVDSTTRWMQTSGMKVTNRPPPAAVQGGGARHDALNVAQRLDSPPAPHPSLGTAFDNRGEKDADTSLPLLVNDHHHHHHPPPPLVSIVERSIRHVEPPPLYNITAAVCFKTLFGEIDLGLVIQWAGTCKFTRM